LGISSSIHNP